MRLAFISRERMVATTPATWPSTTSTSIALLYRHRRPHRLHRRPFCRQRRRHRHRRPSHRRRHRHRHRRPPRRHCHRLHLRHHQGRRHRRRRPLHRQGYRHRCCHPLHRQGYRHRHRRTRRPHSHHLRRHRRHPHRQNRLHRLHLRLRRRYRHPRSPPWFSALKRRPSTETGRQAAQAFTPGLKAQDPLPQVAQARPQPRTVLTTCSRRPAARVRLATGLIWPTPAHSDLRSV
mmetsp:Transcript_27203/g.69351  ORF Transcript_27203/g.69351 Transcript_27203/m.69351 type:complete len:233 (-) Transcript_27203:767-1465(-)